MCYSYDNIHIFSIDDKYIFSMTINICNNYIFSIDDKNIFSMVINLCYNYDNIRIVSHYYDKYIMMISKRYNFVICITTNMSRKSFV